MLAVELPPQHADRLIEIDLAEQRRAGRTRCRDARQRLDHPLARRTPRDVNSEKRAPATEPGQNYLAMLKEP